MTGPKRHHYVPCFYLKRFATSEQVYARRRQGPGFSPNCINVAVESGLYDYKMPDGTKSGAVEAQLSVIEDDVATILSKLDGTMAPPEPNSVERRTLALYLGLQVTRTPEHRERTLFPELVLRFLEGRELTRELISEYLETHYLGFTPQPREVDGAFSYAYLMLKSGLAFTPELVMDTMFEVVEQFVPPIESRFWTIEHARKGGLISSDSPLVIWRPPSIKDEYEGVGLADCDEVRFPISPYAQLVLSKRRRPPAVRITPARVAACNEEMAAGCHNFIFGNLHDRARIDRLYLRKKRPVQRFDLGPLVKQLPDGSTEHSKCLHMWIQRRDPSVRRLAS